MNLWNKLMNGVSDFLWFTFFVLLGAGLTALFFLTYFIPQRDSLRELVRVQQTKLLQAQIGFAKEQHDRKLRELKTKLEKVRPGAAGANDIINGDD